MGSCSVGRKQCCWMGKVEPGIERKGSAVHGPAWSTGPGAAKGKLVFHSMHSMPDVSAQLNVAVATSRSFSCPQAAWVERLQGQPQRGIVISAGHNESLANAFATFHALKTLNCSLPVAVM